ncbi:MAG: cyclic peptide export ABC transporter [Pyrinomonadaceae bacterium]
MKLLAFLFKHSRGTVILAALISIIGGVSSAVLIALINSVFIRSGPPARGMVWYFGGLVLIALAANLVSESLLNSLSERTLYDLRMNLCRQVIAAPLRRLEEVGAHKFLAALTDDIPHLSRALLSVPMLSINLTLLAGCLIYLGWLSMTMLLPLIVFLILAVVSVELLEWFAKRYLKAAREEWNGLLKHFHALTEGNKELKLHRSRREAFVSENLEPTANVFRQQTLKGRNIYTAASSWTQALYFIVIGLLLFAHSPDVSAQTLIGYTVTFLFMRSPIIMLINIIPLYGRASISLQKVNELSLSLAASDTKDASEQAETTPDWNHLRLKGITHSYYQEHEGRNFILGPVDLTFRPGELILVVGGNGSGKTTFAKILTGLYAPESGEIEMNGHLITDENRDHYRQNFSVVFSEFYLFDQLLGLGDADLDTRAHEYLTKLQLDHKVEVRDGRLSTTNLSRGQRKRLALLTSYLEDRPIYVFDEWAADQDPLFKELFYYQLLPELKAKGKTVIVISHDDRYYHIADRIIKLDYGKVEYDKRNHNQNEQHDAEVMACAI